MNRRTFLQVTGATIAGAISFISFGPPANSSESHEAGANSTGSVQGTQTLRSFTHRRRQVDIVRSHGMEMLQVDGRMLPHHVFTRTDAGYASHLLPFRNFKKPDDLARLLLDGDGQLFRL